MSIHIKRQGFTLIETLISLTLLTLLFSVLGGLLFGMSRLAQVTSDTAGLSREVNFCFDLMRKELGEVVIKENDPQFLLLVGRNFFSYATIRQELISRDDIARGLKRVEWRYFPAKKLITRSTTPISPIGQEVGPTNSVEFLKNTESFELGYFFYDRWHKIDSTSEELENTNAITITLKLNNYAEGNDFQTVSTSFILPRQI